MVEIVNMLSEGGSAADGSVLMNRRMPKDRAVMPALPENPCRLRAKGMIFCSDKSIHSSLLCNKTALFSISFYINEYYNAMMQ